MKIRSNAKELLESSSASCRVIAIILGRIGSSVGAIPLARVRARRLQWDYNCMIASTQNFDSLMVICDEARRELCFWRDLPDGLSSPISLSSATASVTTDASDTGIGILFDGHLISETIPKAFSSFHINVKELYALKRFLENFPELSNAVITWRCDNNSALAAIRKEGSTRSWEMSVLSCSILTLSHERHFVGSHQSFNRRESLSRCRQQVQGSTRLELVQSHHQQAVQAMGHSRRRPYGLRPLKKGAAVLLLEQTQHRGLGDRQSGTGCQLESIQPSLLLPTIPSDPASPGEVQETGSGQDDPCGSMVVGEDVLSHTSEHVVGCEENPIEQPYDSGSHGWESSSRPRKAEAGRVPDFWEIQSGSNEISKSACNLVEASWRGSTEKRYGGAWGQWTDWCKLQGFSPASPSLNNILDYLASLFDKGAQYRTINLHRATLSSTLKPIDGFCVGQHPLVCRLLQGAYNLRPPRPKLCPSWSVNIVLETLKNWSPASKLSLKVLTFKTVMLVALAHECRYKDGTIEISD